MHSCIVHAKDSTVLITFTIRILLFELNYKCIYVWVGRFRQKWAALSTPLFSAYIIVGFLPLFVFVFLLLKHMHLLYIKFATSESISCQNVSTKYISTVII